MNNGWTGGQYSFVRFIFGAYLCLHFIELVPWAEETFSATGVLADGTASPYLRLFPNVLAVFDAPAFVTIFVASAIPAAVLFAVGYLDRSAAVWIWYVLACLFGRNPLTLNPSLPFVGWLLLAHACLPPAPFGSLRALGRTNPDAGWHYPRPIFAALWIVMAVAYSYSGYTKLVSPSWIDGTAVMHLLQNPLARPTALRDVLLTAPDWAIRGMTWSALGLELLFAPLALIRRARPWIWFAMLMMHLGLMTLIDFADLSAGMIALHLFSFNPDWIPARSGASLRLFYDGHCGLCHRSVRFLLAEDRAAVYSFGALQSDAFEKAVPPDERRELPDSIVVIDPEGKRLIRSTAIADVLLRLGGLWHVLGVVLCLVPRPLRDAGYRGVAAVRHRVFRRPADACPIMPAEYRKRFMDQ